MLRRIAQLIALMLVLLSVPAVIAQDDVDPSAPKNETVTFTEDLEGALAEARRRLEGLGADADESQRSDLSRIVTLLERRVLLRDQGKSVREGLAELEATAAKLASDLEAMERDGPEQPGPYTILQLDAVTDEIASLKSQVETSGATVEAATLGLADARRQLESREAARRRFQEDTGSDGSSVARSRARRIIDEETGVAARTVRVREAELKRAELNRDALKLKLDIQSARVRWMTANVRFEAEHLNGRLSEITDQRAQLQRQLELVENNARFAETTWFNTRSRLTEITTEDPELTEEVEARRIAYEATREEQDALSKAIERLGDQEDIWRRRYQLVSEMPELETLREWEADARARIAVLETERRLDAARLDEVRGRITALSNEIAAMEAPADGDVAWEVVRWIERQLEGSRETAATLDTRVQGADEAIRAQQRLLDEIGQQTAHVDISERLGELWSHVTSIWRFELTSIDEQPITVGKIVIGFMILLFGLLSSRFLSRMLGKRVLPRLKLNEGAAAAVQSILFYVLIITFTLFAFRAVNIPLTAFTVLGGALAIGVGFGSQNIINNFISGLILLAERPVRVGDLIEVDDLHATVEHIGARSTRVRTGDNVEVIIPNSTFLEQNVVNWTLSEDRVRTKVIVGVAYGSPTRDVSKLLKRAVEEHGRVLKSPEPIVIFADFGDSALVFEVHFWIRMRTIMQRRGIESDIRHRIDNLFEDAGIVIAFPQRDIHVLGGGKPVEVKMVAEKSDERDEASGGAGAAASKK